MPKFKYKVRELSGEETSGEIEAADRFAAAAELRSAGKSVISVEEDKKSLSFGMDAINARLSRVKVQDLIVFSHNLSAMMKAGLSLSRGLSILERQTKNLAFKKTLKVLIDEISKGSTLSAGMAKFPKVFSPIFVSMVRAGEESGGLSDALLVVGDQLEKSYLLGKKVKGAMIYPSVVIATLLVIGLLMFIYVVPTLAATFKELNTELPASTKFIIGLSDFLSNHFLAGVVIALLTAGSFYATIRTKRGHRIFEFSLFRIPVIGTIVRQSNAARTARTLSSLLSSGVDMLEAINITRDVLQNSYYKEVLTEAGERVQKGVPLSSVFAENTYIYPLLVGDMIEVGEETGKLSDMLFNVALFYENEVDDITKNISTIIEPVLMVVIGGSVGFFAVSMISPMYSVMSNI
ncbi:MAG: type II secretion system F family protein [Candidatus Yonathbacteria bacterium]|nr:type II secretion system F family protein [Candidatus Yonathbacteria bacterium]